MCEHCFLFSHALLYSTINIFIIINKKIVVGGQIPSIRTYTKAILLNTEAMLWLKQLKLAEEC